jgi:hypothetical protein
MRYAAIDPSGRIAVQVLRRSRETLHAMTAAVATRRADLDFAPAVPCTTTADARTPVSTPSAINARPIATPAAIRPFDISYPHATRAGTA